MMVWVFFRGKRIKQTNTFGSMQNVFFLSVTAFLLQTINDFSTVAAKYHTQNGPPLCLYKQQLPTLSQLLGSRQFHSEKEKSR